jgi:uncharacterized protein with HEPN domain
MSKRDDRLLLADIVEAAEKIDRYTLDLSFESFKRDDRTIDAVVRNLEIIGEAANRLSVEFREKHHHIEWHRIIGLRNRVIHEYFGIDVQIIWHIVEHELKPLREAIDQALHNL